MAGPEIKVAQQEQLIPQVAEKGRLPAPTETILPIFPFDKAVLMIIARYPIPMVVRLGHNLPEAVAEEIPARRRVGAGLADYISDRLPASLNQRRLSRGRRGSRGSLRGHSSRRCGVCEECRNTQGSFARNRCRGWMAGSGLLQSFQHIDVVNSSH